MTHKPTTPNRFLLQPSTAYADGIVDYITPKSRDANEAARRRQNPSGTLVLEKQLRGLEIARLGLSRLSSVDEVDDWANSMSGACIGASQYHFEGQVMNRYLRLPMLARTPENPRRNRPDAAELFEETIMDLSLAELFAERLIAAQHYNLSTYSHEKLRVMTGKVIAQAAFKLANVSLANQTAYDLADASEKEVQLIVRQRCLDAVQKTQTIGLEIGAQPSLAQIAEPLSPLAVELQKASSDKTVETYQLVA